MKAIFFAAHSLQNPESRVFLSLSFYYYYYDDFFFFFYTKETKLLLRRMVSLYLTKRPLLQLCEKIATVRP